MTTVSSLQSLQNIAPFRILIAIPHLWLRETIMQMLADTGADIVIATSREALLSAGQIFPDLVLVDPFAFNESGLDVLGCIQQRFPNVGLIVLLSLDICDYRDAVVHLGVNDIIATDKLNTDLLPAIERLLVQVRQLAVK